MRSYSIKRLLDLGIVQELNSLANRFDRNFEQFSVILGKFLIQNLRHSTKSHHILLPYMSCCW